ncbi:MAG: hypothetical protein R3B54_10125 [Bdellovibrionota bacterium]
MWLERELYVQDFTKSSDGNWAPTWRKYNDGSFSQVIYDSLFSGKKPNFDQTIPATTSSSANDSQSGEPATTSTVPATPTRQPTRVAESATPVR